MPIILNGTTGITTPGITNTGPFVFQGVVELPAGAVGAPSLTTTGDTNTGIYFPAADTIGFVEGGVESMRLTSAGNVGIGTNNPVAFSNQTSVTVNGTNNGRFDIRVGGTHTAAFVGGGSAVELSAITSVPMTFATNSVERMRLDTSGNLGLGVTPSAWTSFSVLQSSRGSFANNASELDISHNAFYDGNWKYIANGFATNHYQFNGTYVWRTAPSGTAGNTISFTQAMTLDASGRLGIGTTSPGSRVHAVSADNTNTTVIGSFDAANQTQRIEIGFQSIAQYSPSDPIRFLTGGLGGSERARITSGGDFGIGTSSPVSRLNVAGTTGFTWVGGGNSSALVTIGTQGTSGGSLFVNTASLNSSFASGLAIDGTYSGPLSVVNIKAVGVNSGGGYGASIAFHTSNETTLAERARITFNGEYFYNCTGRTGDAPNVAGGRINEVNGNEKVRVLFDGVPAFQFYSPTGGTGGPVGTINVNAGGVSYNTTSDVRLKKNIENALDAGHKFDALRVCQFDWKTNGDHVDYGFIAQELNEVVPDAVSKPMNPDEMWGVDYSKLVPMLVKEIQSLRARLAAAGI